jgi:hypothetical protein
MVETQLITKEQDLKMLDGAWETMRASLPQPTIEHRPEWLASEARSNDGLMVVSLRSGGETHAIAPFLLRKKTLPCRIGYRPVVSFPLLEARLCGNELLGPMKEELLEAVGRADVPYDALFLEGLAVDSPLRKLIDESPIVRRHFWKYCPFPATKHWTIRIPTTFAEYDGLSGKNARRLKRYQRALGEECGSPVYLERITAPEALPEFIRHVTTVSGASWQGRNLGQTFDIDSPLARRMKDFAQRGWFRGYLLRSASTPIVYLIGHQADGRYYAHRVGYDPKYASFGPGNILFYRVVEDLATHDRQGVLDFGGGDSEYKHRFGTDAYDEQHVYLFRRSAYGALAQTTHRAFAAVTGGARAGLERFGLAARVRKVLRRGSVSSHPT